MDISDNFRGFKKNITPKHTDLSRYKKFLYTASVGVFNRSTEEVVEAYWWASQRYPIRAILLGDGLYKISLRITEGLNTDEAEKRSIKAGDELICSFFKELCVDDLNVFRTSELLLDPAFLSAFERVESLYSSDLSFRTSVEEDAGLYVKRQKEHETLKVSETEGFNLSVFYLKQEISVYLLLAGQGWLADLYLGQEIPTLAKIMRGEIPAAPDALKQRVNVGLQKKRNRQIDPQDPPNLAATISLPKIVFHSADANSAQSEPILEKAA